MCDNCGRKAAIDAMPNWLKVESLPGMYSPILCERFVTLRGDFCTLDCLVEAAQGVFIKHREQESRERGLIK